MEVEHAIKVLPIDEKLQENVEALSREGWELLPGVKPIAIYHVARAKPQVQPEPPLPAAPPPAGFGMGELRVDDTKVLMLGPDGKLKQ